MARHRVYSSQRIFRTRSPQKGIQWKAPVAASSSLMTTKGKPSGYLRKKPPRAPTLLTTNNNIEWFASRGLKSEDPIPHRSPTVAAGTLSPPQKTEAILVVEGAPCSHQSSPGHRKKTLRKCDSLPLSTPIPEKQPNSHSHNLKSLARVCLSPTLSKKISLKSINNNNPKKSIS